MMKHRTDRFPFAGLLFTSLMTGLIYAQFHLFGNTTEVEGFGRSAFKWMMTLWKSGRIFGGTVYYLGWIIPMVTLGLIYQQRREITAAPRAVCWPAILLVLLGLFLHWAGARAQQTRLSLIALILLLWAIPFFLYGWPVAKRLLLPAGLLIFCVPLNFLDAVIFPMRVISAHVAELLLNGLGVAVTRAGSVITMSSPSIVIDGADPASGLGTLLTITAAVFIAGHILRDGWILRVLMPGFIIPVMIFSGSMRLASGALLATFISPEASRLFHDYGGLIVMFCLSAVILVFLRMWLMRLSFFAK